MSSLYNHLGGPLRSWGSFRFFCLSFSGGGSKVVRWFFLSFFQHFLKGGYVYVVEIIGCLHASWISLSLPISSGILRSCLRIAWLSHACLAAFSLGSSSLVLLAISGVFQGSRTPLLSPNIGYSSTLSKQSSSSQRYVTQEKYKTSSKLTKFVDKNTERGGL